MSKEFYKNVKIIRFCKVCDVSFRMSRNYHVVGYNLCIVHRREFWRAEIRKQMKTETFKEYKKRNKAKHDADNRRWVATHMERRRAIALASYHKNKHKHKRKHKKTTS